jgi:predicted extracellular nuclease
MTKYTFFLLAVLVFLGSCATNAQQTKYQPDKTATFMFYNVENLFDTIDDPDIMDEEFTPEGSKQWNSKRYYEKLNNLSEVIGLVNTNEFPEFIAVSEVENEQVLLDLTKTGKLKNYDYKVVHHDSNDGRGIDVGMLYRADAFRLRHSELIPIEIDASLTKYPLREILYLNGMFENEEVFHIFVNHWKSRRGGEDQTEFMRVASAKTLRKKTDEIFEENSDAKIIIAGDMNDEPENKSLSETLDAKLMMSELQAKGLFNLMFMKSLNGQGTYSYRGQWNMLDNLIVSEALMNSDKGYKVYPDGGQILYHHKILYYNTKADDLTPNKTYGGDNYYGGCSDHLPVYFILEKQ